MKKLMILCALLCVAAGKSETEWTPSLSVGEVVDGGFSGTGSLLSVEKFRDFAFSCSLAWDKENEKAASFGFYFEVEEAEERPYYQVIINQKSGTPQLYVAHYNPGGTGKRLQSRDLPSPLDKMGKIKLGVAKKKNTVRITLNGKKFFDVRVEDKEAAHLRILVVDGVITCEDIQVKTR